MNACLVGAASLVDTILFDIAIAFSILSCVKARVPSDPYAWNSGFLGQCQRKCPIQSIMEVNAIWWRLGLPDFALLPPSLIQKHQRNTKVTKTKHHKFWWPVIRCISKPLVGKPRVQTGSWKTTEDVFWAYLEPTTNSKGSTIANTPIFSPINYLLELFCSFFFSKTTSRASVIYHIIKKMTIEMVTLNRFESNKWTETGQNNNLHTYFMKSHEYF